MKHSKNIYLLSIVSVPAPPLPGEHERLGAGVTAGAGGSAPGVPREEVTGENHSGK